MTLTHLIQPSPGQLWEQYVDPPFDFSSILIVPGQPGVQIVVTSYHLCPANAVTTNFLAQFVLQRGDNLVPGAQMLRFGAGLSDVSNGPEMSDEAHTRIVLPPGDALWIAMTSLLSGSYPDSGPFIRVTGYFLPVRLAVQ